MGNIGDEVVLSYPPAGQFTLASSGLNFWKDAAIDPDLSKESETITLSLNIPYALDQDATVTIGIDESAVDEHNQAPVDGETQYALMPSDYYTLVDKEVSIPAGVTDVIIEVAIHPEKFDISETGYILPISILSAKGVAVSKMNTAFIHVEKDPNPPLSRADWAVVDFSSEEAEGEGADNGRVKHLLDNNSGSFWHSQWQGGQPGPPHWFIIDMGKSNVLNGIMILPRQGVGSDGRPKDAVVEVSEDNATWSTVANITFADDNQWQKIEFDQPTESVRYFKATINTMHGSGVYYTNMAELKMF